MLPIQKLITRPQNISGCSVSICGPGWMPWIMSAPMIKAIVTLPGIPSVIVGMKDAWSDALLADSGAMMPSIAPRPKRSGVLEVRFSSA